MNVAAGLMALVGAALVWAGNADGAAVATLSNKVRSFNLHRDGEAWKPLKAFPIDTAYEEGIGPNDVDWQCVTIAHASDARSFFIRYQLNVAADLVAYPAFYNLFIDADEDRSTGYVGGDRQLPVGADYLIQGANVFVFNSSVQTDFAWTPKSTLATEVRAANHDIVLALPAVLIGNPRRFRFVLLGDNAVSGHTQDYYPDESNQGETGGYFEYTTEGGP